MKTHRPKDILQDLETTSNNMFQIDTKPQEHQLKVDPSKLVTPTQHVSLKKRVSRCLRKKENKTCLDCSKPNPRWITILSIPPPYVATNDQRADTFFVGGLCCLECSGAHRRLGTHISFVRSIELDSLKESEVQSLESGGNGIVNRMFEGKLLDSSIGERCSAVTFTGLPSTKPDTNSTQRDREHFIRNKYEKKLYTDIKEVSQFRQSRLSRNKSLFDAMSPCSANQRASPASSTTSVNDSTSPLKLQVFTSSPRTLAMIEKYMNPKPKRKNLGRIIRNSLCRRNPRSSKKKYFQKSLRGLRGIVGVNPNVNVVETRSLEFDESDSECEFDKDENDEERSVTSTQSSMSAFLRRRNYMSSRRIRRYQQITKPSTTATSKKTTTTPTKAEKKRRKSKIKNKKKKKNSSKDKNAGPNDGSEEEMESFELKNEQVLTTPKSCKSPLFRLTPYLKTPKRKNFTIDTNPENACHVSPYPDGGADEVLNIVTEEIPQMNSKSIFQNDISSMKAWSDAFERIMNMSSRKKRNKDKKSEDDKENECRDDDDCARIDEEDDIDDHELLASDEDFLRASTM
jgi:hypothetical protein